ncbi:MAG: hypothetical protein KGZ50_02970 [Peptococcaceae bacterium]|jgi:hypothetical protein|nr:hypothetical protein [Peptococcaceae bacterium]HSW65189.1 hypothetical protein [Dissulfurispiraceae bacterium]
MIQEKSTSLIQLKDYEGRCNVLFPTVTMQQISPFHRIRVEEVKINPDPEAGDVFKVGSKKVGNNFEDVLSLSKTAVLRLSTAAGIVWNWAETRVLSAGKDYVLYQAVGAMRKPSGEWIPLKATKEIDLEVVEAETYDTNLETAKKLKPEQRDGLAPEEWAEAKTRKNMIQWKKNKLMRAETGAMLRVVRALLSVKHQYSAAELKKPFAVPTVDFAPDYSDPEVRKAMAEAGIRATSDLFGQSAVHQLQAPQQLLGQPIDVDQREERFNASGAVIDADVTADVVDNLPWTGEGDGGNDVGPPWEGQAVTDDPGQHDMFKNAIVCQGCDQIIAIEKDWTPQQIADYSQKRYGKKLCVSCQKEAGLQEKKTAGQKAGGGR